MEKAIRSLRMPGAVQGDNQGGRLAWAVLLLVLAATLIGANLLPPLLKMIALGGDEVLLDYLLRVGEAMGATS